MGYTRIDVVPLTNVLGAVVRGVDLLEPLDAMFHTHCQRAEYQVRHHWQRDTIAMWDNRCTQHRVVSDNVDALRKMERITLCGETPS